ncbi:MAG: TldD/PmbA family protein [Acidobacteriota bacterium]|nr:TldD/PmbA family protein [Acidobacteriota bacterium]MDH3530202.1 TldD/PmbA family protein [Acidobacteriota bacterium]
MLLSEDDARKLTAQILSYVKADDAQASVRSEKNSNLRFANNAFLTSGSTVEIGADITVWKKGRSGSASTSDFEDSSLKKMVEQAEKVAELSPVDKQYLPTLGKQTYKSVDGYADTTANVVFRDRAERTARIISDSKQKDVIAAGFHEARSRANATATRNGNFEFERSTFASLSVTARAKDGSSSGYFERGHHDIKKLDTDRVARESISKASNGRGAKVIEPGVYPVILEPQAVGDLYGRLRFQFDARLAEEGRSPFSVSRGTTKLGQKVFDEKLTIMSDPWNKDAPGSQSAQDGLPAEKLYLVRNGVVENLVYSRYWAETKKVKPTAGPVNMIMHGTGNGIPVEEMIKVSKKALLIGRFWYIRTTDARTASVTGLTRDGVWMVENGKIAYPVTNLRFNESLINALAPGNVEGIGVPERIGSSSMLPALKLKTFNFTSISEAV